MSLYKTYKHLLDEKNL